MLLVLSCFFLSKTLKIALSQPTVWSLIKSVHRERRAQPTFPSSPPLPSSYPFAHTGVLLHVWQHNELLLHRSMPHDLPVDDEHVCTITSESQQHFSRQLG